MDADYYRLIARIEDTHWWFVARREILSSVLRSLDLPHDPRLLDVGSGTGGNLPMLSEYGRLLAIERDRSARRVASERGVCEVLPGSLPGQVPCDSESFDVITVLDVIEHIEDDGTALEDIRRLLAPGGRLLITVPAFPFLWSHHDEVNHHFRRYTRTQLCDVLRSAGFEVVRVSYFNTWLFPLVVVIRLLGRLNPRPVPGGDFRLPPRLINRALRAVFSSESNVVARRSLPFGVSIFAVARAAR